MELVPSNRLECIGALTEQVSFFNLFIGKNQLNDLQAISLKHDVLQLTDDAE